MNCQTASYVNVPLREISPTDFVEVCLPSLHEQARRAGRAVYHLDGAPRHARALAEDSAITAIQYTPGDGTPSALAVLSKGLIGALLPAHARANDPREHDREDPRPGRRRRRR